MPATMVSGATTVVATGTLLGDGDGDGDGAERLRPVALGSAADRLVAGVGRRLAARSDWSRRKYVKCFPTVGYWLSLVPVLPTLRDAIGRLCCTVLVEHTSRYATADHHSADEGVPADAILRLLEIAQEEDPIGRLRSGRQTLRSAGSMASKGRWSDACARLGFGRSEASAVALANEVPTDGQVDLAALVARIGALETELAELRSS
jgi:hypothetical protein